MATSTSPTTRSSPTCTTTATGRRCWTKACACGRCRSTLLQDCKTSWPERGKTNIAPA